MITSTGNINHTYVVLGTIHTMVSMPEKKGCSDNGLPILDAYKDVTKELQSLARQNGGNGIINIGYEQRVSAGQGCSGNTTSNIELYAWGTAIEVNE